MTTTEILSKLEKEIPRKDCDLESSSGYEGRPYHLPRNYKIGDLTGSFWFLSDEPDTVVRIVHDSPLCIHVAYVNLGKEETNQTRETVFGRFSFFESFEQRN
jgi:hypothetical protein